MIGVQGASRAMSKRLGRASDVAPRLVEWLRSLDRSATSPTTADAIAAGDTAQGASGEASPRLTRSQAWLRILLVLVAVALLAVQASLLSVQHGVVVGVALGLATAHVLSAPLALAQPVPAAGLSLVMVTIQALVMMPEGAPGWPWAVAPQVVTQLLVLFVLTLVSGWRLAGGTLLLQLVAGIVLAFAGVPWNGLATSLGYVALFAALALLVGSLAVVSGRLVEIGEALRRERTISAEEHVRRTMVEEKSRIARELHDVIAHNMSLITVQARSAPHRVGEVSESASAEFAEIADRAAEALRQMRGVLDVLRTEPGQSGLVPVPGVDGLPGLVESASATGQRVDLHGDLPVSDRVTAEVGAAAYRILQEALSNARRHAPDSPVRVDVLVGDEELSLRVTNQVDGQPEVDPVVGADGHGVLGMQQRASAVGGSVTVETTRIERPARDDGETSEYVVTVRLPLQGSQDAQKGHA